MTSLPLVAASGLRLRLLRGMSIALLVTSLGFAVQEWREWTVFRGWVAEVRERVVQAGSGSPEDEGFALAMMKDLHRQLYPKLVAMTAAELQVPGFALRSNLDQLNHPSGACASFSHVLTKCLLTADIDVRKVGLSKGGNRAIHHVVEAKLDGRWVLLDPLFDQSFRSAEGKLSGAAEVGGNRARPFGTCFKLPKLPSNSPPTTSEILSGLVVLEQASM